MGQNSGVGACLAAGARRVRRSCARHLGRRGLQRAPGTLALLSLLMLSACGGGSQDTAAASATAAPLEQSIRLARPAGQVPLALGYAVALELPLAQPWQARQGRALLTIKLDPAAGKPVLADASLGEGALVQQLVAHWAAQSTLRLTTQYWSAVALPRNAR